MLSDFKQSIDAMGSPSLWPISRHVDPAVKLFLLRQLIRPVFHRLKPESDFRMQLRAVTLEQITARFKAVRRNYWREPEAAFRLRPRRSAELEV